MKTGWNTWNTHSMLSHVLLPEGFSISIGIKKQHSKSGLLELLGNIGHPKKHWLREALIGKNLPDEQITPGAHAYDGSFTSLEIDWQGITFRIETAVENDHWYARATPLALPSKSVSLTIEAAVLWNRPGTVVVQGNTIGFRGSDSNFSIYTSEGATAMRLVDDPAVCYLAIALEGPIDITTDPERLESTASIIERKKKDFLISRKRYGDQQDMYDVMQRCLAWNTIYDPSNNRIITPVSRLWSHQRGGWVLFEWDTYFAAWMAGLESKELAYANAKAVTDAVDRYGFVPNCVQADGYVSRDRSQPPIGAITIKALCDMFNETVLAEMLFDQLLTWNRWWVENRDQDGYLCWGSTPSYRQPIRSIRLWRLFAIHSRHGAALESGLDNSPMYDGMAFDRRHNLMQLADIGLMSLYIADCRALAELAVRIHRNDVTEELTRRAEKYAKKLNTMWDEETGLYLNLNLKTGEFEHRLSPTHFYPLLAGVPSLEQAHRMINEHFFNPDEFWGEWILPSIARNDPAYPDQDYWRGRIWAPMNFLVYLGLKEYDLPEARLALVEKSAALLRKEWQERRHVHENYCADTGEGCNKENSDSFYHWGGLLGLMSIIEVLE